VLKSIFTCCRIQVWHGNIVNIKDLPLNASFNKQY
jgi:hypothetical protein